jgi:uncharacterized protein YfeS
VAERYYFDDPDEGPARETSHPTFVRLCKAAQFYDSADDDGPFGNDAGHDVLRALEDWYRQKRHSGTARDFIDRTLAGWDIALPDLGATAAKTVNAWLADEELSTMLPEIDDMLVGVAFGQLKITGSIDADIRDLALAAITRQELTARFYKVTSAASKTAAKRKRAVLAAVTDATTERPRRRVAADRASRRRRTS